MNFLDENICKEIRETVNSTNIFYRDDKEKNNYNLICAVLDRIDDSVNFLNNNYDKLSNYNDILLFFVHSCIIVDAVESIMNQLGISYKDYNTTTYFNDAYLLETLGIVEEDCITDVYFFRYLRSIIFAHPFETNRIKFLKRRDETHYSPYLISERYSMDKDKIGIMIYSNKFSNTISLYIPKTSIYNYIDYRYKLLNLANTELKKRIENKNKEWMKSKINKEQTTEQILVDILNTLNVRYNNTYDIETFINIIKYKSQNLKNEISVNKVKDVIISFIPQICDCIDNLDYENYYEIVEKITNIRIQDDFIRYQIQKILTYLNFEESTGNQEWGKSCAKIFAERFANKWVDIDVDNMNYEEIKLLTIVACYLEKQEEIKLDNKC